MHENPTMTNTLVPNKPVVLTNLSSSTSGDISGALNSIFERYGYGCPVQLTGQSKDMGAMLADMRAAQGDLLVSYGGGLGIDRTRAECPVYRVARRDNEYVDGGAVWLR